MSTTFFLTLLFITIGLFLIFDYIKERREYRNLIKKPEDILEKRDTFVLVEYPNRQISYVEIDGKRFKSTATLALVFKDLAYLRKNGYLIHKDYMYDSSHPPPKDTFKVLFERYESDIDRWLNENQGRGDVTKKPVAPYDFSRSTVQIPK